MRSPSAAATAALGEAVARLLAPGDVVVLGGELGAGKTTFTGGVARALGVSGPVTSPTFTICSEHAGGSGEPVLAHLDLYRLERLSELEDVGIDEILGGECVVVVEWGDTVGAFLGADRLEIDLTYPSGESEEVRDLTVVGYGRRWAVAWTRLRKAVADWERESGAAA